MLPLNFLLKYLCRHQDYRNKLIFKVYMLFVFIFIYLSTERERERESMCVCEYTKVSRQFSKISYLFPSCDIKLRLLCLAASTFTCWAIFLFPLIFYFSFTYCHMESWIQGLCHVSATEIKLWLFIHFIWVETIPNFKENLYLKFVLKQIFLCCMLKYL